MVFSGSRCETDGLDKRAIARLVHSIDYLCNAKKDV